MDIFKRGSDMTSLYLPQRLIGEGLIGFSSKLCEVVKKYPNQIMTPLLAN